MKIARFSYRALSHSDSESCPNALLLEDRIGLEEDGRGKRETEGLRGLEVEHPRTAAATHPC